MRYLAAGLVFVVAIATLVWFTRDRRDTPRFPVPVQGPVGEFVGSSACQTCHPAQHSSWHDSYHRTMTQVANESSVIGDFNSVHLAGKNLDARLFRENGAFKVELHIGQPDQTTVYDVVMTTGSHNRQAYWLAAPGQPHLSALPFMYLRAEQRWIPRHAGYISTAWQQPEPEVAQLKGEYGRWVAVCIQCHTTFGQPSPEGAEHAETAVPRVAELGISCESCHGPGARHAQDATARSIVNPAKLPHDRSAQVCGQCHSVYFHRSEESHRSWLQSGFSFRPGDDLLADPNRFVSRGRAEQMPGRPKHVPDPSTSGSFWPDGMIRVTGREFNGTLDSPCYQRGEMSCLSCHQMHQSGSDPRLRSEWAAGQVKPDMTGDRACTQCHSRFWEDATIAAHTHHAAGSTGSRCYNCHMPNTTYGLLKATRSHQITSPSVTASLVNGRPNACNLCHLDRPLGWTADRLADWYRHPKPQLPRDQVEIAEGVRLLLSGDASQRAIASWHAGWEPARTASGDAWLAPYLGQLLEDPYDAVRFIAHRSLRRQPGFAEFPYDFMSSPDRRAAAREKVLHIWKAPMKSIPGHVLIGPDGRINEAEYQRLLKARDDRPIDISE
jgi:hypothetical protein